MPPIEVISNAETAVQAPKPAGEAGASMSELAAQAAEQPKPAKSDTAEPEAQEENDSEAAEDEGEESESNDAEKDKPRKKSGAQRRRERAERDRAEIDRLRRLVEDMALKGAGGSKPEPKVETPAKSEPAGKPNPDQYETHAEYVEALTDWKIEQRDKAAKEDAARSQLKTEQETKLTAHQERVKAFAEKTEDFQDVLEGVDDVQISPTVAELLLSSENGPELMYELAKNRAEYERINKLTPLAAARELGKLEAKLAATQAAPPEAKETKTITNAPKPIAPVGGKGGVVEKSIHDPNLSQREYEAIRRKQLAARKAAW